MTPVKIITATMDELREAMREVLAEERRSAPPAALLSAADAARRVRKSRTLVLAALASGSLAGQRDGRNWKVRAADLELWASAGFPE